MTHMIVLINVNKYLFIWYLYLSYNI